MGRVSHARQDCSCFPHGLYWLHTSRNAQGVQSTTRTRGLYRPSWWYVPASLILYIYLPGCFRRSLTCIKRYPYCMSRPTQSNTEHRWCCAVHCTDAFGFVRGFIRWLTAQGIDPPLCFETKNWHLQASRRSSYLPSVDALVSFWTNHSWLSFSINLQTSAIPGNRLPGAMNPMELHRHSSEDCPSARSRRSSMRTRFVGELVISTYVLLTCPSVVLSFTVTIGFGFIERAIRGWRRLIQVSLNGLIHI